MARIQDKIVFSFVGLLLVALITTFFMISLATWSYIQKNIETQLTLGLNHFNRVMGTRMQLITDTLQNLAEDKTFKQKIRFDQPETMDEFIKKISYQLKSDFVFIFPNKQLQTNSQIETSWLLKWIQKSTHKLDRFWIFKNKIYQVVAIPILDPIPIGWICAGLALEDVLTQELKTSTNLEISFLTHQNQQWNLVASSLQGPARSLLMTFLEGNFKKITINQKDYLFQKISLAKTNVSEIIAIGLYNMDDAKHSIFEILMQMAGVFLLTLIVSLVITILLAQRIIAPIRKFIEGTQKIAQNHAFEPLAIPAENELAELAREFNQMQVALVKRENEIQHRAFYDTLTNLPNRALFQDQLAEAIKIAKQKTLTVAVLVMDLNRFKDINDTLGHQSGDKLLKQIARRLSDTFAIPQFIVSRLGGDEFSLMLPNTSYENTVSVVEKMLQVLSKAFTIEGMKLDISTSIGATLFPLHAQDANAMLQKAEIAMYVAKEQKKAFCFYEQELDKHSVLRLALMNELKAAVKRNELVLYYQPKLELYNHTITQVEALVRWIHPKHGLISPTQFIPLAEQTGYVRDLTRWALLTAAKQCFEWKLANIPIKVAVNISTIDLLDVKLEEDIREVFNIVPIHPNQLILEVTESAIMVNPEHAIHILNQLHQIGILLSLDDFGTGHSSMAQLKKLPVQELKIDRSFISNMSVDKNDEIIVKSMIELGHNMGLTVVGEGVNDAKVFELLKTFQCDNAQGHFISPPLSITEFSHWLLQSPYRKPTF